MRCTCAPVCHCVRERAAVDEERDRRGAGTSIATEGARRKEKTRFRRYGPSQHSSRAYSSASIANGAQRC